MKNRAVVICVLFMCLLLIAAGCTTTSGSEGAAAQPTKKPVSFFTNLSTVKPDLSVLTQKITMENEYNKAHNYSWTAGITSISRMSDAQKKYIHGKKPRTKKMGMSDNGDAQAITVPDSLPESFDWRDHGGDWTTPIKDQNSAGSCGSCWAHADIAALESYYKIKNNDANSNPDFSEQYLISCNGQGNTCDGGSVGGSLPFIVNQPGLKGGVGAVKSSDYPYDGTDSDCKDLTGMTRYAAPHWAYVEPKPADGSDPDEYLPSVEKIKAAIYQKGPIVASQACADNYDDYTGGIWEYDTGTADTDHMIVLVGWGKENGKEYFIAKNSWGTDWGEKGWFKNEVRSGRIGEGAAYLSDK